MADNRDETTMVDVSGSEIVEITVTHGPDGAKVWVNVDGVCRFRAYRAKRVTTEVLEGDKRVLKLEKAPAGQPPARLLPDDFCCPYHDMYGGHC